MVYDTTSSDSFDHVNDWLKEVNRYASEGTCKLLVGNKCDRTADRAVTTEQAKEFADDLAANHDYYLHGGSKQQRRRQN